jgi:hypothetical protein
MKCLPRRDRDALLVVVIYDIWEKGTEGLLLLSGSSRHHAELSACSYLYPSSSTSAVIVMQSTQNRQAEDLAIISIGRDRSTIPFWNLLSDALPVAWLD